MDAPGRARMSLLLRRLGPSVGVEVVMFRRLDEHLFEDARPALLEQLDFCLRQAVGRKPQLSLGAVQAR